MMDVIEGLKYLVKGYSQADPPPTPEEYSAMFIVSEAIKEIENLRGKFKQMVLELQNNFVKSTGEQPGKIYVTKQIENEIYKLTYADVGPLVNTIAEIGPRKSFKKIFGMEVVWDADEFKVERSENGSSAEASGEEDGSEKE